MTINTTGNNATGSSGTISYSLGQVFYTYTGALDRTLAQGIQHTSVENVLATNEIIEITNQNIIIYPNPVKEILQLKVENYISADVKQFYLLFDLQGRLLKEDIIEDVNSQIDMTNLKSALYIFNVYRDNKVYKTFKVIKN